MDKSGAAALGILGPTSCPRLAAGVRLTFDRTRENWILLAPERVFMLDEVSLEIVQKCDGATSLAMIVDDLARNYSADRDEIELDVRKLLQDLLDKKVMAI